MHSRHSPLLLDVSRTTPDLEIREYRPGDEELILDAFNRVFAAIDPTFVPRTMKSWRWQYLDNPSKWRMRLAFTPDGQLVSQYAGVGQRVLLEGKPANFSQAVDSMTDPEFGRGLKRPGAFVLTGYPYAANYGGPPPDHDTIMWGAPVRPAWRIGKAYLEYEFLRYQQKLHAPPAEVEARASDALELEEPAEFPAEVEALFRRCAQTRGAIAVRDKAQLDWRYIAHPDNRYTPILVRRSGELVGYAVYRHGTFSGTENCGIVCDWLAPETDDEVRGVLLARLKELALRDGADSLVASFPDTAPEWIHFQEHGLRVAPTRHFLVGRNYVPRFTMEWLYHNWYYTLGDTDLV